MRALSDETAHYGKPNSTASAGDYYPLAYQSQIQQLSFLNSCRSACS